MQLWINVNGTKSWMLDYQHPITRKRSSISFGTFPAVSLADARNKRNVAKELLAKQIDPKELLAVYQQLSPSIYYCR